MCAIVGSLDTDKLKELARLNEYRGNFTHSISYYDIDNKHITINKHIGPLDINSIDIPKRHYGVCHLQAPTSQVQEHLPIHPAMKLGTDITALWHNGIIKDNKLPLLRDSLVSVTEDTWKLGWDTYLILLKVLEKGVPDEFVDGSYSCLWYNQGSFYLFRNEISPMFIDDDMNISSTKFEGSRPTKPNIKLKLDLNNKRLVEMDTFKTKENPYFFIDN